MSPQSGVKPPNPQFWGVNMRFQAKLVIDFNQILHSDKDHQMSFVGGPNTRITNPSSKNRKITISRPRFERFRQNLAR